MISNVEADRRIMMARDYRVWLCRPLTQEDFDAILDDQFRPIGRKTNRRWGGRRPEIQAAEKPCSRCNTTRKIAMFHLDSHRRDGHTSVCRDCRHLDAQEAYRNRKAALTP